MFSSVSQYMRFTIHIMYFIDRILLLCVDNKKTFRKIYEINFSKFYCISVQIIQSTKIECIHVERHLYLISIFTLFPHPSNTAQTNNCIEI